MHRRGAVRVPGYIHLFRVRHSDPQYELSKAAYDVLASEGDAQGRKLEVVKLHIPNHVIVTEEEADGVDSVDGTLPRVEGDRQAASYANFYIANGAVILPIFGDEKHDIQAVEVLQTVCDCLSKLFM